MERNDHHFLWEKSRYHGNPLNTLRGMLVAREVLVVRHNDLHAALAPPPLPSRPLAHNMIDHLKQRPAEGQFDAAFNAMEYLQQVATYEALGLAEHFEEQLRRLHE